MRVMEVTPPREPVFEVTLSVREYELLRAFVTGCYLFHGYGVGKDGSVDGVLDEIAPVMRRLDAYTLVESIDKALGARPLARDFVRVKA